MEKRNNIALSLIEINTLRELDKLLSKKWFYNNKRRNLILKELEQLQGSNNIRLLKYMLLLALDSERDVSIYASSIIENIMRDFDYKDFIDLDGLFRNTWHYYNMDSYIKDLEAKKIIRYMNKQITNKYVITLLTFHSNGFIREMGVELISKYDRKYGLICAILRLNDWVKQIRDLSLSMVKKLADDNNKKDFLESIPLLDKISRCGRADHLEIIEFCSQKLRMIIDDIDTIELYFHTDDLYLKRSLYHKMTLYSKNIESIIKKGLSTKDLIILKYLIEFIKINKENPILFDEIHKLSNHKLAAGRAFYLSFLYENESDTLKEVLLEKLFDKSAKVRNLSRFYLQTKFGLDVIQIYRDSLENTDKAIVGICGLGELGDGESYEKIEAYLNNADKKIVLATLKSLSSLDIERTKSILFKFLLSDNKHYSLRVRKILKKNLLSYGRNLFEEAMRTTEYEHVKENILLLSNTLPKWESLHFLIDLYEKEAFENNGILDSQMNLCMCRINSGFTRPNENERKELLEKLEHIDESIYYNHVIQLNDILKSNK